MSRRLVLLSLLPLLALALITVPRAPAHAEGLEVGESAVIRGDGDCVRLRSQPSLAGERITCIPDGATVLVLEGTAEADGFRWQRIQYGVLVGWSADEFLAPAPALPAAVACTPSGGGTSIPPGIAGAVPASGVGLVVWGGGTAQGIAHDASLRGSHVRSIWSTGSAGMTGYLVGAPDFVNRPWFELFPRGEIPAGTPLLVLAGSTSNEIALEVAGASLPPPARSGSAPLLVGAAAPSVDAAGAIVIDEASGAVLFEHNAHSRLAPASLTKIATSILAIEGSALDGWAQIDVDFRNMPGSSVMGLLPGDCFTVRDLLHGLMLPSGNDAALAIGRYISGSDEAFVASLNALVLRLGLTETHFANPHGLDEPNHVSSAYDLAMLTRYGMSLPTFVETVGAPGWTAVGSRELTLRNVNRFLASYSGADGVKTGFTEDAGRTLIASATRDGGA